VPENAGEALPSLAFFLAEGAAEVGDEKKCMRNAGFPE
jgi:hypothetical protein